MKISQLILFAIFLFCGASARCQNMLYSPTDSLIYEKYIADFSTKNQQSIDDLIVETGLYFLDRPYVASTLEISENERLILNLREFDCTTFVENCIALSKVVKSGDYSFANYCRTLQNLRYRNGIIEGYPSRLHYTSDWIIENEQHGLLKNISINLGGNKVAKRIDYMTTHVDSYKHLKNDGTNLKIQQDVEKNLNKKNGYSYIPKLKIINSIKKIKPGDIIVFATSLTGMDYSHIGIAYKVGNELHFIHASSTQKKTVIEKKTLLEYCNASKSCTGITVLRINN